MRFKLMIIFVVALAVGFLASPALADKMICISDQTHQGEVTVGQCLAEGHRFAIFNKYGVPQVLGNEEIQLIKQVNPAILDLKSYSIPYMKQAPEIPPIKDYFPA